jgi:hypothetical protein
LPEHLGAGEAGHHEIEEHQVGAHPIVFGEALRAVRGVHNLEAFLTQHVGQRFAVGLLILDDQYPRHSLLS